MGDILMPDIGKSSKGAFIRRWFKTNGQAVRSGDLIVEIETDKAVFELESEEEGVLTTRVESGGTVQAGQVIATTINPEAWPPPPDMLS